MIVAISNRRDIAYLPGKHPRKELIEYCTKRAIPTGRISRMYRDKKDGSTYWCGYVIGNDWWSFYAPWEVKV